MTGHAICTAGTPELIYRCYQRRTTTLSVTTTGRPEQLEDGTRCRHHHCPLDLYESAVGWMEQLADVGQRDQVLSGLKDHATTWSGPMRQSDARDLELLCIRELGQLG
jgi:hypothetical protein